MRAAAVQFKPDKHDPAGSLARLAALTERAGRGADLVVLPEMAASGYIFDDVDEARGVAESPTGRTFAALSAAAASTGAWVVAGFPEVAGDLLYNSAMVIDDRGELAGVYRKTLLFDPDEAWAQPGDTPYPRFRTAGGTFAVGICMDLNDPRFLGWLHEHPVDALAFPTNWIDEGIEVWPYWAARIAGSKAVMVAANTYGEERGWAFCGRSAILTSRTVLAGAPPRGDALVHATW